MKYPAMRCYPICLILALLIMACEPEGINTDPKTSDAVKLASPEFPYEALQYHDTVYIPIYSDIYSESKDVKFLLTATLSIRNTSLTDTIYIGDIRYYDSGGALIRNYLKDEVLVLKPMQSIEYVIERNDTAGGTGANFLLNWAARTSSVNPVFQGVMISTHGQQGISFITEGVSISRTKPQLPDKID